MRHTHTHACPIGIFDSGMGGLTVAQTITATLPHERIVYFGDTAHAPWGSKSIATVQAYAVKICEVLLQHHCKLIVVACHTASAVAFEMVREYIGHQALVVNVIDPVIHSLSKQYAHQKIGLIGTKQTIHSNVYKKRIDSLNQNIELVSLATPLLVPLIEEGFATHHLSAEVVQEYLSNPVLENIDALILGCTHYPLIKQHIQRFYDYAIPIIDAADFTAQAVVDSLTQQNQQAPHSDCPPQKTFYVSDDNPFFTATAQLFFSDQITLEPYPLWETT